MARRRNPKGLTILKVYPETRGKIKVAAGAEGMLMVEFVDALVTEYLVTRKLEQPAAAFIAYAEAAAKERKRKAERLRAEIKREILAELQEER